MIKFKNNILIKNIFILLLSGGVTKILAMLSKIVYTRIAGIEVVSLYTMLTPTFMLIITICQFSFPISISKISAENKYNNKRLLLEAFIIGLIIDVFLIIIILLFSNKIALMLHNKALKGAIDSICIIIPFVTITSIQRGFLHGKEDMLMPSVTNILEEIIKILLIVVVLPFAISKGNIIAVIYIILFNIFMEFSTMIILNKNISKYIYKDNKDNNNIKKDILNISLPTTLIRLIASIGLFLEPIILTNVLITKGLNIENITMEYGIINSYIIPLLSFPNFFSISIAAALLPNITKLYVDKKYNEFNNKLLKLLLISIIIGLISLTFILIFPDKILKLVFNINLGINYIYLLGPCFILLYLQPTLSIALQAMGKTNKLFKISIINLLFKYISLYLFTSYGLGMNSLIYSIMIGILVTTTLVFIVVIKEIKKNSTYF